jgi:hypothetical protein
MAHLKTIWRPRGSISRQRRAPRFGPRHFGEARSDQVDFWSTTEAEAPAASSQTLRDDCGSDQTKPATEEAVTGRPRLYVPGQQRYPGKGRRFSSNFPPVAGLHGQTKKPQLRFTQPSIAEAAPSRTVDRCTAHPPPTRRVQSPGIDPSLQNRDPDNAPPRSTLSLNVDRF